MRGNYWRWLVWRVKISKLVLAFVALSPALVITLGMSFGYASTGEEAEGTRDWTNFAWRAFNFVVLTGLVYWLMAEKIKIFFHGRQEEVKTVLADLSISREHAEKKYAEYSAKLEEATEEIQSMAETIRRQGLNERERIIAAAQKMAGKMTEDAHKRMEQEMKIARQELRAEAAQLSLEMARQILQQNITVADHAVMVEDYIDKVVSKH